MKKELNFKVGKFYVDGHGEKWECLKTDLNSEFPIAMTDGKTVSTYTNEGYFYTYNPESPNNIVGEWVEKPIVDWSVMPAWANFVAMDKDGKWYWHYEKPTPNHLKWIYTHWSGIIPSDYAPKFNGDWTESLIERP